MPLSTSTSAKTFNGDGANTTFDTTFPVWKNEAGDALIQVTITDVDGSYATTDDYSVADLPDNKIRVTYPVTGDVLAAGQKLTITRDMDFLQALNIPTNTKFLSELVIDQFDKLTAQDQQLKEALERTVKTGPGSDVDPDALLESLVNSEANAADAAAEASGYADEAYLSAEAAAAAAAAAEEIVALPENVLVAADLGVSVQEYDEATAKTDVTQAYSKAQRSAGGVLLITAGAVAWDMEAKQYAELELTGDVTTLTPSNHAAYAPYLLIVKQDATGGRTLDLSAFLWPDGEAPDIPTDASAVTILSFISDGTNLYGWGTGLAWS